MPRAWLVAQERRQARVFPVALLQLVVKPKPEVSPPPAGLLRAASLRPAGRARPAASRKPVGQQPREA